MRAPDKPESATSNLTTFWWRRTRIYFDHHHSFKKLPDLAMFQKFASILMATGKHGQILLASSLSREVEFANLGLTLMRIYLLIKGANSNVG